DSPSKDEYVEGVVCNESDIKENEMKACQLGDAGKVLVVKHNGKISAVGAKCTHYGAPLVNGALGDGKVRCPWHGACFDAVTGDIEDYPGLDSLPCFQVEIKKDGGVHVRAKRDLVKSSRVTKPMVKRNPSDPTTIAIIGGGPAGLVCAEVLRQKECGFTGRIVLICMEPNLPYDRCKVGKALELKIGQIILRKESFYKEHDIEFMKSTEVTGIDTSSKILKLGTGSDLEYTKVFIATGGLARRPNVPGSNLKNVFVLRTVEDSNAIYDLINKEANIVVLGASYR
ncbi:hypothetical protein L9F63_010981, partial [Diploptera punctata]